MPLNIEGTVSIYHESNYDSTIGFYKIENSDKPSKNIVYPIAILLLVVFGYFNLKRKE